MTGSGSGWQRNEIFNNASENDALIWFKYWRPPIETLMNGSQDNYYAALQLMYPCMERMYQLKEKRVGSRGLTIEVLKHFFTKGLMGDEDYNHSISALANGLRNGLIHDASIRDGVGLLDGAVLHTCSGLTDNTNDDVVISARFLSPVIRRHNNGKDVNVLVNVQSFWEVVRHRIDSYYTSFEYTINYGENEAITAMLNAVIQHKDREWAGMLKEAAIESAVNANEDPTT